MIPNIRSCGSSTPTCACMADEDERTIIGALHASPSTATTNFFGTPSKKTNPARSYTTHAMASGPTMQQGQTGSKNAFPSQFPVTRSPWANRMDTPLDADGDGIITEEEWEAERQSRGSLASAVTRKTTAHSLATDYPGATVKNQLGPRNPHVLNTPFTAVPIEADKKTPPSQNIWWQKPKLEMTAAEAFEAKLAAQRATQ